MPGKFKIVVSDLHLGAGFVPEGNLLEDFERGGEFAAFLSELAAESDREEAEVELIVNGDAFEMLQVPNVDTFDPAEVYPPQEYHSSSEPDSVLKMALIIAGHQTFFEALGSFVQVGPPRRYVTFIKGNHDINLHWPAVQGRIQGAMGLSAERSALLTFEERRVSREGIYVEHGNQYASITDRLKDMEEPHDPDDPDQLALPVGSWFVMDVFNEVEREKYWIDGVKPILALVWYSLAYDFAFAARALAVLLRALPGILGEVLFDADANDPHSAFVRQLEDPEQVAEMAARYEADEAYRAEFNAQVAGALSPPTETPDGVMFSLSAGPDPVAMGEQVQLKVDSALYKAAKKLAAEERAKVVVFGHTHDVVKEPLPTGGHYLNCGTWTWCADFSGEGKETWQDLFEHPERFTEDRLLSYVRIDYDEAGQPAGELLNYENGPDRGRGRGIGAGIAAYFSSLAGWLWGLWQRLTGKG